jgi:hypothetical protein
MQKKFSKKKIKLAFAVFQEFDDGIRNHLTMPLWAYYANDFKGCVIEIEKEYDESIKKINYISSLATTKYLAIFLFIPEIIDAYLYIEIIYET